MVRIKGGALLWVITLSVILLAVLVSLLLMQQYSRRFAGQLERAERLERHAASGMQLLLAGDHIAVGVPQVHALFDDSLGRDTVILEKRMWGVYRIGMSTAFERGDTLRKMALLGTEVPPEDRLAVYLADENRPVSVSGRTTIRGKAFLPPAGVRKAYIEGQAYEGADNPVAGTIASSRPALPSLSSAITALLFDWLKAAPDSLPRGSFPGTGDSLLHPFNQPALVLETTDSLLLGNIGLSGNILLHSTAPVIITADTRLDGVLIFAPEVAIHDGFSGELQVFARDSIVVGSNCFLRYPSALAVLHTDTADATQETQPELRIGTRSRIEGLVCTYAPERRQQFLSVMKINRQAVVMGQVYADGLLELQGTVEGSTWCRRFMLQTPSTLYENFILNGVMDHQSLSPDFAGVPLLGSPVRSRVVKWLL